MSIKNKAIFDAAGRIFQTIADQPAVSPHPFDWRDGVYTLDENDTRESRNGNDRTLLWGELSPYFHDDTSPLRFDSPQAQEVEVAIDTWSKGLEAKVRELSNPVKRETYMNLVRRMSADAEESRRKSYFDLLLEGDTAAQIAYDGQFMFDTDHPGLAPDGSALSQANVFDLPFSETNLDTVIAAAQAYRDETGRIMDNRWYPMSQGGGMTNRDEIPASQQASFHIICGPALHGAVAALANPAKASPSKYAGSFTFESAPELIGSFANYWFVRFSSIDPQQRAVAFWDGGQDMSEGIESRHSRDAAEWAFRYASGFAPFRWGKMVMVRN